MTFDRIWRLIARESRLFASSRILIGVVILMPLFYTVLLGYIYDEARVTRIPAWISDHDQSSLSRSLIEAYKRHELIKIVKTGGTLEEFKRESQKGNVFAYIIIPKDFEKNLKKNKQERILTFVEGSNLLITNMFAKAAAEIAGTYSAGAEIKRLNAGGTPAKFTQVQANPIMSTVRILNNPTTNYKNFLMPGLIGAVIQQVTLLGVALAFSREREEKKFKDVLGISSSPIEVLLSKTFFYGAMNFLMGGIALFIMFTVFHIKFAGSLWLLLLLLFVFISCLVALGVAVSVVCDTQLAATQALMMVAVPSFMISGYTWPQFSMNSLLQLISNLMPLTHFVLPIRDIALMSAGYEAIRPHLIWMWSLVIISYAVAYPLTAREMKKIAEQQEITG